MVVRPITIDDIVGAGVSAKLPPAVHTKTYVLRRVAIKGIKFRSIGLDSNNADGKDGSGLPILVLDAPGTKEVDLNDII
eukprot:14136289-Ditylum_brightwellii.AAC.2